MPQLEVLEGRALLSTFTVRNLADSGAGSLRQAIYNANTHPGADVIRFAGNLQGTITLTTGELDITGDLTIDGPGAETLAVSGNHTSRVLNVGTGVTATIDGLTITDGRADGNSPAPYSTGGGVLNRGILTLSNDVLSNNQAIGAKDLPSASGFPGAGNGGGVANLGRLTAKACQFIDNQALGADGSTGSVAGSGIGGGIANPPSAVEAIVTDCRFAGNVAQGGSHSTGAFAGAGLGGATSNASKLSITGSIFTTNQASGGNDNTDPIAGADGVGAGGAIGSGSPGGTDETLKVSRSIFVLNKAVGGDFFAGPNSGGVGGAIGVLKGSGDISDSTFDYNQARGGRGAAGSPGGLGVGGGFYVATALAQPTSVTVSGCTVDQNSALGGPGGSGGNGGNGWGGGFANIGVATLTLTGATVQFNLALGGAAGSGGSDGLGIGGGVYTLGIFSPDDSVIRANHASTSGDDIGP